MFVRFNFRALPIEQS